MDGATTFLKDAAANATTFLLDPLKNATTERTVLQGYTTTYTALISTLLPSHLGAIELLLSNTGSWVNANQTLAVQAALQHPFSRGTILINSTNPFEIPLIDSGMLKHPADIELLLAGVKCTFLSFDHFISF